MIWGRFGLISESPSKSRNQKGRDAIVPPHFYLQANSAIWVPFIATTSFSCAPFL